MKQLEIPLPQNLDEFRIYCQELYRNNFGKSTYLEIGSRHGGSLYLASGFLPKGSTIITIDLPNSVWGIENSQIKLNLACETLITEQYNCYHILSDSQSIETQKRLSLILNGRKIDAIFFDGDHSLKGITADWNNYSGLVRVNGIYGFHDIRYNPKYPKVEVSYLWNELKKEYASLDVTYEHGIGIIWNTKLL